MILVSMSKDRFAQVAGQIMASILTPQEGEYGFPDPGHCAKEAAERAVEFAKALDTAMIGIRDRQRQVVK